jgi:hypothetical protein
MGLTIYMRWKRRFLYARFNILNGQPECDRRCGAYTEVFTSPTCTLGATEMAEQEFDLLQIPRSSSALS